MNDTNKICSEELKKMEEEHNKKILSYEFVIMFLCLTSFFVMILASCYGVTDTTWQIVLMVSAICLLIVGVFFSVKLEAEVGYYECQECKHRYVPKYTTVIFSPHFGRTRYMKCPECGKRSWSKKKLTK